jgi:hypothetical protein
MQTLVTDIKDNWLLTPHTALKRFAVVSGCITLNDLR